jgi:hypothetical protein
MHFQQVCVVAVIICCWAAAVSCQGLLAPTEQDTVGARLAYSSLTSAFQRSKKWKAGYRIARRAQCSPTGGRCTPTSALAHVLLDHGHWCAWRVLVCMALLTPSQGS